MAEELLRKMAGDRFEAESAGLEPGQLNPLVIEALKEEGIDIRGKAAKAVFDLYKQGKMYSYVITVCDEAAAERCPVFPGPCQRFHWSFTDPTKFQGTDKEKLEKIRKVKEDIKGALKEWTAAVRD